MKHCTDGIVHGLVASFNGAILVVSFGTSRKDIEIKFGKESTNAWALKKFTALIHVDIPILGAIAKIAKQPAAKPGDGRDLGTKASTIQLFRKVIVNQKVAGFATGTDISVGLTVVKLGGLAGESKVDAQTLTGLIGCASVRSTTSTSPGFGSHTNWAIVQDRGPEMKFGHTLSKKMSTGKFLIRTVTESLVPQ